MKSLNALATHLVVLIACVVPTRAAVVLVHDTFDVPAGGVIGTDITVGNDAGDPLDVAWSMPVPGSGAEISVVTTPVLGASGNSLQLTTGGGSFQWMRSAVVATGGPLAIDDYLELTLKAQYAGTPANNGSGFRFGLFQNAAPDNAYGVFVRTGTNNGPLFDVRRDNTSGGDGVPGAGGTTVIPGSTIPDGSIPNSTTGIDAYIRILRVSATDIQIDATINGVSGTFTDTSGIAFFDAIYIRNGNISTSFRVDDIKLVRGVIPEPASLMLMGLGSVVLLARRRAVR
jgi:hypothetical protein